MRSKKTNQNNPNKQQFWKYSLLASAIMGFTSTAYAAENQTDNDENELTEEVETIEISGTRQDWQSAQAIKQSSSVVVDAISASDVGVLPDRSVLEAIARVPGVTMSRIAEGNDSEHFGTEGTGVNVRGLTFVRSEFNNRDSFSASGGSGLNFADVPPELLGSVEVFKSPMAKHVEGGIGGTVNLNTKKPFDSDKQLVAVSADMTYADYVEKTTPSFSGLYSNVLETADMGKFGLLVNYSNSELQTMSDSVVAGRYQNQILEDGSDVWIPRGTRLNRKKDTRNREGAALVLQWENPDKTIRATGEYIRSDASLSWAEKAFEVDANSEDPYLPVMGTEFTYNDDDVFQEGIMLTEKNWRGNDAERQPYGGRFGKAFQIITRQRDSESLVEDLSLNVRYTPTENLAVEFDLQHVEAEASVYDMSVWSKTFMVVGLDLQGSGMPAVDLYSPSYDGQEDYSRDNDFLTSKHSSYLQSAMDHVADNMGEEDAATLDFSYIFDDGLISSVEFGGRYANRDQVNRQTRYNWGSLSEAWTNDQGGYWLDSEQAKDIPTEIVTFDGFGRGSHLTMDGDAGIRFPAQELAADYDLAKELLPTVTDVNSGSWQAVADRPETISPESHFAPNEINDIEQTNKAFYVQANFDGDLDGFFFSGNFGVRHVSLTNTAAGFLSFPDNLPSDEPLEDGAVDQNTVLPQDQKDFGNNAYFEQSSEHTYSTYLPSFNLKVDLADDVIFRLGLSKSIAMPDLGMLRNHIRISGTDMERTFEELPEDAPEDAKPKLIAAEYKRYTASAGNPGLKPLESTNIDLTLEWYFSESGSLTSAIFNKDLKGYFVNGNRLEEFTNNGATQVVQLNGAVNSGEGKIRGFEVAYQQFYDMLPEPFNGFGMQFNYTFIDEEGAPNSGLKPNFVLGEANGNYTPTYDNLPLEGVSEHNANLVGMYEQYGWTARIAYNWRSEYLLTSSDVRSQRPTFNEDAGYLDASLFYQVNDNIKVGIQGTNLSDTMNKTQIQLDEHGTRAAKGSFVNDRRISAILRATF